jgi:hypothetical protein
MPIELPSPISSYFLADREGAEAVSQCFAADATVKDEGQTYSGLDAIRRWKTESSQKYVYTSEPFQLEEQEGKIVVTSRLVGDFPGSPIDLRYFFGLEGDKIASLEIGL